MSIYATLRNAAYEHGYKLTADQVELEGALDGNLCRCTGYKPILDAAKTFVGEYVAQLGRKDAEYTVPVNVEAAHLVERRRNGEHDEQQKLGQCSLILQRILYAHPLHWQVAAQIVMAKVAPPKTMERLTLQVIRRAHLVAETQMTRCSPLIPRTQHSDNHLMTVRAVDGPTAVSLRRILLRLSRLSHLSHSSTSSPTIPVPS